MRAAEGDPALADLSIIAKEGPSAAVYLTAKDCFRVSHFLGEIGDALAGNDIERGIFDLIEAVRAKSEDARFCIVCHGDAAASGSGFDHEEGCELAHVDELRLRAHPA